MISILDKPQIMLLTEARLTGKDIELGTVRIDQDDWWFSMTDDTTVVEATDSQFLERIESQGTLVDSAVKKMRTIHKDSVGVKLGGDKKVLLQLWECVVLNADAAAVYCEMHDLTNEQNPIEYAEVLWSEFNEYDKPLLTEGAVFYWSIGHLRRETGQVRRFSETRLRRMPKLSKVKMKEISRKVERLSGICKRKQ